jgi:hypothetical protein
MTCRRARRSHAVGRSRQPSAPIARHPTRRRRGAPSDRLHPTLGRAGERDRSDHPSRALRTDRVGQTDREYFGEFQLFIGTVSDTRGSTEINLWGFALHSLAPPWPTELCTGVPFGGFGVTPSVWAWTVTLKKGVSGVPCPTPPRAGAGAERLRPAATAILQACAPKPNIVHSDAS